jgi:hypothetical protein
LRSTAATPCRIPDLYRWAGLALWTTLLEGRLGSAIGSTLELARLRGSAPLRESAQIHRTLFGSVLLIAAPFFCFFGSVKKRRPPFSVRLSWCSSHCRPFTTVGYSVKEKEATVFCSLVLVPLVFATLSQQKVGYL